MGRKKIYKSVAEKQRAWRIRSGKQKVKVPVDIRRGESLGTPEGAIRAKGEEETWQHYHEYIRKRMEFKGEETKREEGDGGDSVGAKRAFWGGTEPEMSEDYYELRAKYELELEKLPNKGRKIGEKQEK